jgi:hypothetical protein
LVRYNIHNVNKNSYLFDIFDFKGFINKHLTKCLFGFISTARKIAGKERKIMGWKKGIHLLRRCKRYNL